MFFYDKFLRQKWLSTRAGKQALFIYYDVMKATRSMPICQLQRIELITEKLFTKSSKVRVNRGDKNSLHMSSKVMKFCNFSFNSPRTLIAEKAWLIAESGIIYQKFKG